MAIPCKSNIVVLTLVLAACGSAGSDPVATVPAPAPVPVDFPLRALMLADLQAARSETATFAGQDTSGPGYTGTLTLARVFNANASFTLPDPGGVPPRPQAGAMSTETLVIRVDQAHGAPTVKSRTEVQRLFDAGLTELASVSTGLARVTTATGVMPATVRIGQRGDLSTARLYVYAPTGLGPLCGRMAVVYDVLPDTLDATHPGSATHAGSANASALLRVTTYVEVTDPACGTTTTTEKVYRMTTADLMPLRGKLIDDTQILVLTYQ